MLCCGTGESTMLRAVADGGDLVPADAVGLEAVAELDHPRGAEVRRCLEPALEPAGVQASLARLVGERRGGHREGDGLPVDRELDSAGEFVAALRRTP